MTGTALAGTRIGDTFLRPCPPPVASPTSAAIRISPGRPISTLVEDLAQGPVRGGG